MPQTIKTNVIGTLNMLGLAKRVGARYDYVFYLQLDETTGAWIWHFLQVLIVHFRILLTSTSEVYGDPLQHPQTEEYWGNVNPIGISFHLKTFIWCLVECFIPFFYDNIPLELLGVRSCYDEGKRVAETLMFDYHRQHGIGVSNYVICLISYSCHTFAGIL